MKLFFAGCVAVLTLLSAFLYWTLPEERNDRPIIYWITQDDVNKQEIITVFHEWLRDQGLPDIDLRIDNSNQDPTKKMVQGVSGVGADIFDLYAWEQDLFPATGMLMDLTEPGKQLGFSPEQTYPALRSDLVINGRQYGFPRNTGVSLLWVNRATFAKYGLPEPPDRWTLDEFEALGRRFVAAANPPGTRQRAYFVNGVTREIIRRSLGLGNFNETGTRCMLDDPRNVEVLERMRRWVQVDRLMPTREEFEAMSADISGAGSIFSHFTSGRYAMVYTGHWAFIMIRPRGVFPLRAIEPPHGGFPNTEMGGGMISVYQGTKHPTEALRFMQYLASDHFNRLIIKQADSLPPLPRYAQTEEFLHPPGRENEWGVHGAFAAASRETGITVSNSPFVLQSIVFRIELEQYEAVLAGRQTAAQAAQAMGDRINSEIQLTVGRDPALRALHAERTAIQRRIEEYRAAGRRVPAAWVTDPFHLAHYRAQGWLEEEPAP